MGHRISDCIVDAVWATIKRATEEGQLGGSAKVATAKPNPHATDPHTRVICVYTYDDDAGGRRRIRQELRALGFTDPLSWKANSATRAGRYSERGVGWVSSCRE